MGSAGGGTATGGGGGALVAWPTSFFASDSSSSDSEPSVGDFVAEGSGGRAVSNVSGHARSITRGTYRRWGWEVELAVHLE